MKKVPKAFIRICKLEFTEAMAIMTNSDVDKLRKEKVEIIEKIVSFQDIRQKTPQQKNDLEAAK